MKSWNAINAFVATMAAMIATGMGAFAAPSTQPVATAHIGEGEVRGFFDAFSAADDELYTNAIPNSAAANWTVANIPRFECPDATIERAYYFRWWTFRKHLRRTADGWVVTEYLPPVLWAGKENTISCPLNHHVAEGRWLRDTQYISNYLRFMIDKGTVSGPRAYSCAPARAALDYASITGDYALPRSLLPRFVANCDAWEMGWRTGRGQFFTGFRPECGLYDIKDAKEGTEFSLSGHGARPMVNSMRWADLDAVAKIAAMAGDSQTSSRFAAKADALVKAVDEKLWNASKGFYTDLSGDGELKDVCELHGYAPFYFGMNVTPGREAAFKRLMDVTGFLAPLGLVFPARDTPGFQEVPDYKGPSCTWDGPSWPYATSVALTALANVLKTGGTSGLDKEDFARLVGLYAAQHILKMPDGTAVPWIDEDCDAFTGEWIARRICTERTAAGRQPPDARERGKDYNHSTFCDLVISGLCGIGADAEGKLEVKPLAPDAWNWWCIEGVRWRGRDISVYLDRYGKGLVVETGESRNDCLLVHERTRKPRLEARTRKEISCRPKGVFVPFRAQNQTISPTLQCNGQNGKLTQRHRAFETTTFINTHNIKYMFCASV